MDLPVSDCLGVFESELVGGVVTGFAEHVVGLVDLEDTTISAAAKTSGRREPKAVAASMVGDALEYLKSFIVCRAHRPDATVRRRGGAARVGELEERRKMERSTRESRFDFSTRSRRGGSVRHQGRQESSTADEQWHFAIVQQSSGQRKRRRSLRGQTG